jgi:membrane dipeptidase
MHQVLDVTRAPVVISHSNAAALVAHPRNTPDDVLARIPANGGLVMATFVPEFLSPRSWSAVQGYKDPYGKNRPGLSAAEYGAARKACIAGWERNGIHLVADHLEHFRSIVGEDHIGIGSDFYGGPNPPGLEDASTFPALIAELVSRGWSDTALEKLMGGNFLRVWRNVLAAA